MRSDTYEKNCKMDFNVAYMCNVLRNAYTCKECPRLYRCVC